LALQPEEHDARTEAAVQSATRQHAENSPRLRDQGTGKSNQDAPVGDIECDCAEGKQCPVEAINCRLTRILHEGGRIMMGIYR